MIANHSSRAHRRAVYGPIAVALVVSALTGLSAATAVESVHRGVAVVNDVPISAWDVDQRTRLVMASSGAPDNKDIYQKISAQVLRTLIDEQLQMQEATTKKVAISAQDVKEAMERLARQNNTSLDKISAQLDAAGVNISALESQVRAELAWSKLVEKSLAPRIRISETEVNDKLKQFEETSDQPQYQLAQIFVPVERPEDEDEAKTTADNLLVQVRATRSFANVAKQFSKDASAASGGDLGWMTLDLLPPELSAAIKVLSVGQMTVPIRSKGGYYILLLRDVKVPAGTKVEAPKSTLPPGQINITQVIVPMQARTEDAIKKAAGVAEELRSQITSCKGVTAITKGRARVNAFGVMALANMQEGLRNMLPTLPNNSTTPIGMSPDGPTFFIICDGGTTPKVNVITPMGKDEVEQRLYNQQLSVLARRYLRDLRRDAVVEMR